MLDAARQQGQFQRYRIRVEEGVYRYENVETRVEGDLADLSSKGRAISYIVVNHEGSRSNNMVYRLAQFFQTQAFYDKIILDYHTYLGPDARGRVFLVTPDITSDPDNVTFKREVETRFNGNVVSSSLLLI
jgi:hypothetical protein